MSTNYEFGYQSPKQKLVLLSVKGFVVLLLASNLHSLGWDQDARFYERLSDIGGVFIGFYLYANLMSVKIEVQEIFVPPFKLFKGVEFLVLGAILATYHDICIIWNILHLKGIVLTSPPL